MTASILGIFKTGFAQGLDGLAGVEGEGRHDGIGSGSAWPKSAIPRSEGQSSVPRGAGEAETVSVFSEKEGGPRGRLVSSICPLSARSKTSR